ncbi:MAG: putative zinc-binding protein [Candidatus Helarchaeota archaeon]
MNENKVYIFPCSGIGKVFGSIGREATYIVVNELQKGKAEIECLPLIVKGKQDLIEKLKDKKVIVIDGCIMRCAYNDVNKAIGHVDAQFMSTDVVRTNRNLKPERKIFPIGENAKKLARKLAEEIALKIEELLKEDQGGGV